jgi:dual specificity tyrosine-phosphorylation-regulated kinase 2/3/4
MASGTMQASSSQAPGRGQSGTAQSRSSNPSGNDDSGSGGKARSLTRIRQLLTTVRQIAETSARRRLQKSASTSFHLNNQTDVDSQSSRGVAGPRSGDMGRRRLSIRSQKAPQGPRPQDASRLR